MLFSSTGISLVQDGQTDARINTSTASGLQHAYVVPTQPSDAESEQTVPEVSSLEELMAEMKCIWR